jgi:hypothetical protein
MHRLRNQRAQPQPPNTITVEVTVEVHQETSPTFHDMDRSAISPILPLPQPNAGRDEPLLRNLVQVLGMQEPRNRAYGEAALRLLSHRQMRDDHTRFAITTPRAQFAYASVPIEDMAGVIRHDITNLLEPGRKPMDIERRRERLGALMAVSFELARSFRRWMQSLSHLVTVDEPLFHMVRDALHDHTPLRILARWSALMTHMCFTGQTLAALVRQAEETSRRQWPSIILELYFLLLEYATSPSLDLPP